MFLSRLFFRFWVLGWCFVLGIGLFGWFLEVFCHLNIKLPYFCFIVRVANFLQEHITVFQCPGIDILCQGKAQESREKEMGSHRNYFYIQICRKQKTNRIL